LQLEEKREERKEREKGKGEEERGGARGFQYPL